LVSSPAVAERLAKTRALSQTVGAAEFELRMGHYLGRV
jgi:hypothetical protein